MKKHMIILSIQIIILILDLILLIAFNIFLYYTFFVQLFFFLIQVALFILGFKKNSKILLTVVLLLLSFGITLFSYLEWRAIDKLFTEMINGFMKGVGN